MTKYQDRKLDDDMKADDKFAHSSGCCVLIAI